MKSSDATLLSNGAWSLLNQITRVATLAIVTIALSRHFGPQRFGSLAFGLAFVRIFAVIAAFGLDRIVVRHLIEFADARRSILQAAIRVKFGIALASYATLLGIVFIIDPHDRLTLAIVVVAGASLLFQSLDVFDFFFQAGNRFRLIFFGRAVPVLLSTALKIAAILGDLPLLVFAALETFETALIAAGLLFVYRKCGVGTVGSCRKLQVDWGYLLRQGFPLLLGSLAVMIYMRSDILILGKMAGYKAAGIYSAASQITEACALFPMAFAPALFPILVRWRKKGLLFYHQQFERLFFGAVLAGAGIATTLASGAPIIVRLLYGAEYSSAATILVIHAWSAIFIYIAIMQSGYDITEGLTGLAAVRTAVGAALNIVLNFALIPKYGGAGSAIATLISQVCSSFLFNFVHSRTRPIFAMQSNALLLIPLFRPILHRLGGGRSAELSRQFATSSE